MKKIYNLLLLAVALICLPMGAKAETLTVYGTETIQNTYIPIYGEYVNTGSQLTQFIYPQADIAALAGKNITSLKFYAAGTWYKDYSWGTANFTVKIMEVAKNSFFSSSNPSPKDTETATTVYTGTLSTNASSELIVTFQDDVAFSCVGNKDLLIEFSAPKGGTERSCPFYGKSALGQAFYQTVSKTTKQVKQDFLPRVTFTYEEAGSATCAKPTLTPGDVTATTAAFSWTAGGEETQWQYICLPASEKVDWEDAGVETTTSTNVTLESLSANTAYKFYLRAYCSEDDQSGDVTA